MTLFFIQICSWFKAFSNRLERLLFKGADGFGIIPLLFVYLMLYGCLLGAVALPANAQPNGQTSDPTDQYEMLKTALENTLKNENAMIVQLQEKRKAFQAQKQAVLAELNAYKIQLSNYGNMLISPQTRIDKITQAWTDHQADEAALAEKLNHLKLQREEINQLRLQTDGQFILSQQQLREINTDVPNVAEVQVLVERMQERNRVLVRNLQQMEELVANYDLLIENLTSTHTAFTDLSSKFEAQIEERKKQALFKRQEGFPLELIVKQIQDEIEELFKWVAHLFTIGFWRGLSFFKERHFFPLISSVLLLVFSQLLLLRLRKYGFAKLKESVIHAPWRDLTLELFLRSLPLSGALLFLYILSHFPQTLKVAPMIEPLVHILMGWQFTRWIQDFLYLENLRQKNRSPGALHALLNRLLRLVCIFVFVYAILAWILGANGAIPQCVRILFLGMIVLWGLLFWKVFKKADPDAFVITRKMETFLQSFYKMTFTAPSQARAQRPGRGRLFLKVALFGLGDVIIGGSLLLEIAGYGTLSLYWLISWGQTIVVLMWCGLIYLIIGEWNQRVSAPPQVVGDPGPQPAADSFKWLMIRLSWLAWLAGLMLGILHAWGAKGSLIVGFMAILHTTFTVGNLKLSITGFLFAILVLLFIHMAVHLWRNNLSVKFLTGSGLNRGVQSSIKHLVAYLVWLFGILLALNTAGISATSLTVVFGAVGIGLGLGLQNIFNNFVSGLIILFERPIKVDDIVEINNNWGEVREIKFRSTLVKTYDNAALIIPNSQIISQQMTNWSFKDTRIRRSISVGVAYGSDIELVRQTLLEIALNHREVLKHPRPEVLFTDFGVSALMFKLRFWADVNIFLNVETDIRFEIDRRFKENQIKIPFPQRDVHLIQS